MSHGYRPEIDGLRAIAVLPVILYHAGIPGFPGGFIGVDVFFVISGYLITGILVNDLAQGRFSIGRFYERRARRILPALSVVLVASIIAAHLILLPPQFKDFSASVFAVALFLSNMLFISEVDYFAPGAEETPLLHTWSLAVEEQFYILFPLILWVLWRTGRWRGLWAGVVVLTLASIAFSEWGWRNEPAQSFYFIASRAWELSAGALCALLPAPRRDGPVSPAQQVLALGGLVAILLGVALLDRSYPFPSLWALIPVGGSVAVILFATPQTLAGRILSWRPVVGVGLVSYSAYLWHNPVFVFAVLAWGAHPGIGPMLALAALSLVLAALSWRYVEQPFRAHQGGGAPWLPHRWQVFTASAAATLGFVAFGLWGYFSEGRASIWLRGATAEQQQTFALLEPASVKLFNIDLSDCQFNVRALTPDVVARLSLCRDLHGPGLAVIGDSHAINLADALLSTTPPPFLFGMTQGACRPDTDNPDCTLDSFPALVAEEPALFDRVIFEIAGQHMIQGPGGRLAEDIFALYAPETPIPASDVTLLDARLDLAAAYVRQIAAHVPVTWLTPRIEPHLTQGHLMARGCSHDFALRPGQQAIFDRIARAIETRMQDVANVTVIDQGPALSFTMPADYVTCDALLWRDGDHVSPAGLIWLGERLGPVLLP